MFKLFKVYERMTLTVCKDGALILAPSASPLTYELPEVALTNYNALIDAGHKYGIY